jgi:hypothetical protein
MKAVVVASGLFAGVLYALPVPSAAEFAGSLKMLDPATRFAQICDYEAMQKISHDAKKFRPDRAVGDAVSDSKVNGNTMTGEGGAFRSRGKWYRYSFACSTTPDHLKVTSITVDIGDPIPEEKWAAYNLWR